MKSVLSVIFLLFLFVSARAAENPEYRVRADINNIISQLPADQDPVPVISEYLNSRGEGYTFKNTTTVTCNINQLVLSKYQSVLTIYTITGLDSAVTFTPTFTSTSSSQFFDASIYDGSYRSLLDTATHTAPDSILFGITVQGTTHDSAAVTIVGTMDANITPATVYTFTTKGRTYVQRGALLSSLTGYTWPYWGINAVGTRIENGTIRAYIWALHGAGT